MINEKEYTFPFDTCEIPNEKGIAQPYSMIVTFTSCIIILYYLLNTKKFYNFFLIFMILCFQLVHSFSHFVHIKGTIQLKIIHTIVYFIELAFFLVFYYEHILILTRTYLQLFLLF